MVYDVIYQLDQFGLTDIILPFFLIFTVIYAVLVKSKVLGDRKQIHVVLALALTLITIVPHVTGRYPPGFDVINIINAALPSVSLLLIVGFMMLVVLGVFGVDLAKGASPWIGILSLFFLVYIFGQAIGWWRDIFDIVNVVGSDTILLIVSVVAFFWVITLITGPSEDAEGASKKIGKFLGDLFEKK